LIELKCGFTYLQAYNEFIANNLPQFDCDASKYSIVVSLQGIKVRIRPANQTISLVQLNSLSFQLQQQHRPPVTLMNVAKLTVDPIVRKNKL